VCFDFATNCLDMGQRLVMLLKRAEGEDDAASVPRARVLPDGHVVGCFLVVEGTAPAPETAEDVRMKHDCLLFT